MAENPQEYKCPCCGGGIAFDSTIQKMKCPYCDTEFEMETLLQYDASLKNEIGEDDISWQKEQNEWREGEADGLRYYICKSCGGEIIGDETLAATSCPFCNNPVVMMGQYTGSLKPNYVLPFKLTKKDAEAALTRHLSDKKFLPAAFKDQNHIQEVKGIYVPFWIFRADASASMRLRGTRVSSWADSEYTYTRTSYYSITRNGGLSFSGVPVDGSQKMADDLMESIEPFDYSSMVDFQTAYLAGYFADRYDVDSEKSMERAKERIKNSTVSAIKSTVQGYNTLTVENCNVATSAGDAKYALLPVYLLSTKWNGENYLFAMNGQTGKFVGNLPYDKTLGSKFFWKNFLITAAISLAVMTAGFFLMR